MVSYHEEMTKSIKLKLIECIKDMARAELLTQPMHVLLQAHPVLVAHAGD